MKRLRGFLFLVQSLQFYFINIEMSKIWWLITAGYFSKYWQAMYFQETLVFCFLLIKRTQSIWACLFTAADLVSIVVALFQVWKLWPWGLHAHCFTCDPSFDPPLSNPAHTPLDVYFVTNILWLLTNAKHWFQVYYSSSFKCTIRKVSQSMLYWFSHYVR